jgi:hypothetical protein
MPNTPSTRRTVLSILRRNQGSLSAATDQLMYLIQDDRPTLEQMEALIGMAYKLGWKDRSQSIFRKAPPTLTIRPSPDGSWTFLYDGKPRA